MKSLSLLISVWWIIISPLVSSLSCFPHWSAFLPYLLCNIWIRIQNDYQHTRPGSDGNVWVPFMNGLDFSFYRSITDHSCLKVYHKDPAHAFSHAARPTNGDARVSARINQIIFFLTLLVKKVCMLFEMCLYINSYKNQLVFEQVIEVYMFLILCSMHAQTV